MQTAPAILCILPILLSTVPGSQPAQAGFALRKGAASAGPDQILAREPSPPNQGQPVGARIFPPNLGGQGGASGRISQQGHARQPGRSGAWRTIPRCAM